MNYTLITYNSNFKNSKHAGEKGLDISKCHP